MYYDWDGHNKCKVVCCNCRTITICSAPYVAHSVGLHPVEEPKPVEAGSLFEK
jgi:hypothetical protein